MPTKPLKKTAPRPAYALGGRVEVGTPLRKTGLADTPLEAVKRRNGIPGMKKGGRC
jgi:hypothetical protein